MVSETDSPAQRLRQLLAETAQGVDRLALSFNHIRVIERVADDSQRPEGFIAYPCVFRHTGVWFEHDLYEPGFELPGSDDGLGYPEVAMLVRPETPLYASAEAALEAAVTWLSGAGPEPAGEPDLDRGRFDIARTAPVLHSIKDDAVTFRIAAPIAPGNGNPVGLCGGFQSAIVDVATHLVTETLLPPMESRRASVEAARAQKTENPKLWSIPEEVQKILAKVAYEANHTQRDETTMIRNLDMVRDLLVEVEKSKLTDGQYQLGDDFFLKENTDRAAVQYHLKQLVKHGFLEGEDKSTAEKLDPAQIAAKLNAGGAGELPPAAPEAGADGETAVRATPYAPKVWVSNMTWEGHDFLDNIKDDNRWNKTKSVLGKAGGVGLDVIGKVATAFAIERLKHITGLDL